MASIDPLGFMVRPVKDSDLNYVRKTWLDSWIGFVFSQTAMADRVNLKRRYAGGIRRLIERSTVLIACDSDSQDQILGFACGRSEPSLLHYVYSKSIYRRNGIARALVAATCRPLGPLICTHWGWALPRDDHDEAVFSGLRCIYVGNVEPVHMQPRTHAT